MKKSFITTILALMVTAWSAMGAPDRPDEYLGLPGDNLNLYAVMKLFQESETLEAFERELNSEDSRINNLDLNGDNMVDYISVSDYVDASVHNIVMRVSLNQYESQDVAVFIVEELRNGEVRVQLIGDEALYGKNYIIEPIYGETPNPGYMGRQADRNAVSVVRYTYYDIAAWPVIRYIYHPRYVVWRSSWHWGYYPVYWDPWSPYYWHFYNGYHYNMYTYYHNHYRPWKRVRWNRYDRFYANNVRVYSPTVVVNINRGVYRETYSRPESRRAGEELYARTRPAGRSDYSSATRSRTETRSATRTETTRPVTRTQQRSATRTETTRPVTRTQQRSATRTETTRPVTRTQQRSATRTETTRPVTRSQKRSATVKSGSSSGNSRAAVSRATRVEKSSSQARKTNQAVNKARSTRETRSSGKGKK
jgi:hypothetical protein